MATATKTKRPAKKPQVPDVSKKALTVVFGALETAGKRITKFAHEGKKKIAATEHKEERKVKAS